MKKHKFTENASIESRIELYSSALYNFKIRTPVQELMSNARDAWRLSDKNNPSMDIYIPNDDDMRFRIRDYGISMSNEQITGTFISYCTSDKSADKDQNTKVLGEHGLGGKSPFAYTDKFTVITYLDGVKTKYEAHKNGDFLEYDSESTSEKNGVEIIIDVKEIRDIHTFRNAVYRTSFLWSSEEKPNIIDTREVPEWIKNPTPRFELDSMKIFSPESYPSCLDSLRYSRQGVYVSLGGIIYPIDKRFQDEKCEEYGAFRKEIGDEGVVIFEMEDYLLKKKKDRESLDESDEACNFLNNLFKEYSDKLVNYKQSCLDSITSLIDIDLKKENIKAKGLSYKRNMNVNYKGNIFTVGRTYIYMKEEDSLLSKFKDIFFYNEERRYKKKEIKSLKQDTSTESFSFKDLNNSEIYLIDAKESKTSLKLKAKTLLRGSLSRSVHFLEYKGDEVKVFLKQELPSLKLLSDVVIDEQYKKKVDKVEKGKLKVRLFNSFNSFDYDNTEDATISLNEGVYYYLPMSRKNINISSLNQQGDVSLFRSMGKMVNKYKEDHKIVALSNANIKKVQKRANFKPYIEIKRDFLELFPKCEDVALSYKVEMSQIVGKLDRLVPYKDFIENKELRMMLNSQTEFNNGLDSLSVNKIMYSKDIVSHFYPALTKQIEEEYKNLHDRVKSVCDDIFEKFPLLNRLMDYPRGLTDDEIKNIVEYLNIKEVYGSRNALKFLSSIEEEDCA